MKTPSEPKIGIKNHVRVKKSASNYIVIWNSSPLNFSLPVFTKAQNFAAEIDLDQTLTHDKEWGFTLLRLRTTNDDQGSLLISCLFGIGIFLIEKIFIHAWVDFC